MRYQLEVRPLQECFAELQACEHRNLKQHGPFGHQRFGEEPKAQRNGLLGFREAQIDSARSRSKKEGVCCSDRADTDFCLIARSTARS